MKIKMSTVAVLAGVFGCGPANALTLWDAYFLALKNDPSYQAAKADFRANMEEGRIANAALLPQLSLSFYQGDAKADRTQMSLFGPNTQATDYSIKNNQIQLRQSIINMGAWARARQGDLFQDQAKIRAIGSRNELAMRVVKSYFLAVSTLDQVELAKAQENAAIERFNEIQSSLKSGESAKTDLARARAQRDLRVAERIEIQDNLDLAIRQLEDVVGSRVESLDLLPSTAQTPPITTDFTYSGLETYALRNNPSILLAALDVKIAEEEIKKRQSGHYPTLDFVANKSDSDSESINTIGQKTKQDLVALQMQIPLFNGFGTTAEVEKAKAQSDKSDAVWQATVNDTLSKFRTQFSKTQNSLIKIQAYGTAVESAREALKASELAKQFSIQIQSDVLTAQAELNSAEKEFSRIRYESYASLLELHSITGRLDNSDLKKISDFIAKEGKRIKFDRASLPKYEFLDPKLLPPMNEKILLPSEQTDKTSEMPKTEPDDTELIITKGQNESVYQLKTQEPSVISNQTNLETDVVTPPQMKLGPRR